ncbi:MAG: hypothetical protein V9G42_00130, partial [Bacteroidia bacterium]
MLITFDFLKNQKRLPTFETASFFCFSQNKNSVWCFGDSAGIDFNIPSNPVPIATGLRTRGSCVSIADVSGNLLFYANTRAASGTYSTLVYDSQNSLMSNGDAIAGEGWYNELIIVPNPINDSTYYLFSLGVTSFYGIYYSIIDMKLNNGLGDVTVKNVQLQSFPMVDCLNAVKHGNGRDWWVIFRRDPQFNPSNEFLTYLITPSGISNYTQQNVGGPIYSNNADIAFSHSGNKVAVTSYNGLIEILNFDKCTGQLTLQHHIQTGVLVSPSPALWSVAFSPDESKLYITASDTSTLLYQYDLNVANIATSKDTIWAINYPKYAGGGLKLAPDGKIYFSRAYKSLTANSYPYADTMYNYINMNLGVINEPNSLGATCNFQPFSFYLGGKRTYLGLPNNPKYDLGALAGSVCDTLTNLTPDPSPLGEGSIKV